MRLPSSLCSYPIPITAGGGGVESTSTWKGVHPFGEKEGDAIRSFNPTRHLEKHGAPAPRIGYFDGSTLMDSVRPHAQLCRTRLWFGKSLRGKYVIWWRIHLRSFRKCELWKSSWTWKPVWLPTPPAIRKTCYNIGGGEYDGHYKRRGCTKHGVILYCIATDLQSVLANNKPFRSAYISTNQNRWKPTPYCFSIHCDVTETNPFISTTLFWPSSDASILTLARYMTTGIYLIIIYRRFSI